MTIRVRDHDNKIDITYGNRERVVVSRMLMQYVKEARATLDVDASSYKDDLIGSVKLKIEQNSEIDAQAKERFMFELAVYGRAVEKMHPSSLTHITLSFEPDARKKFYSISFEVGKEKSKLAGAR